MSIPQVRRLRLLLTRRCPHPPCRLLDMCTPVGFTYQDKFLELLVHSIREACDDICSRGKGGYMGMPLHFLGLRNSLPAACWGLP